MALDRRTPRVLQLDRWDPERGCPVALPNGDLSPEIGTAPLVPHWPERECLLAATASNITEPARSRMRPRSPTISERRAPCPGAPTVSGLGGDYTLSGAAEWLAERPARWLREKGIAA